MPRGPTSFEQIFGFAKVVTLRFVDLLRLDQSARLINDTLLPLSLPFLDFHVNTLPLRGSVVLVELPLLKLTFIL